MPTYNIKAPQKYHSLGTTELSNGQKLYSYKLANGHRVTIVPMEGSPATVKNYVNVDALALELTDILKEKLHKNIEDTIDE